MLLFFSSLLLIWSHDQIQASRLLLLVAQQASDEGLWVSVCQEMVWEAFRIFWDRLPERDEYQGWVSGCVSGAISIGEVGRFFSQSEEHKELLRTVSPRWL